jgi:uncharacterized protein YegP (UPF0339 family)
MDKVQVRRSEVNGEWYWHRRSENGRIVSTSGETYVNREHAVEMGTSLNPDAEYDPDDTE